jgi:predicted dehydrogenase
MKDGILQWGIVGCGNVVENKSGPSILGAGRSRIFGVMRRDVEKARAFARANAVPLCTDKAAEIIEHPDIDIVYVATPPSSHKEYALAAAEAGKHVLVEKPMGMSEAEDREMIMACEEAGVELFVAYYRRFHPHVLKMKELIDGGWIGQPVMGQIDFAQSPATDYDLKWRRQPEISGGGLFVDVVTHRLDVMAYLLGDPTEVCGLRMTVDPSGGVEDVVSLCIRYGDRALCAVSGDFASGRWSDRFVIAGTEGAIISERLDGHVFSVVKGDETEEFHFNPLSAPHLGLIRHIERVLAGKDSNQSSGRDGSLTDWVLDQGLRR